GMRRKRRRGPPRRSAAPTGQGIDGESDPLTPRRAPRLVRRHDDPPRLRPTHAICSPLSDGPGAGLVLIDVDLVAVEVHHQDARAVGADFGFTFELDAALFRAAYSPMQSSVSMLKSGASAASRPAR